jgi:hypothetical protein
MIFPSNKQKGAGFFCHEIREDSVRMKELESLEIQDEGEEFSTRLDPSRGRTRIRMPLAAFFSRFGGEKCVVHYGRNTFENITKSLHHGQEGI